MSDKPAIHRELFVLAMGSKGAFSYGDVYGMPVHLRKFYLKELEAWVEKKNAQKANAPNTPPESIARPPAMKKR